LLTIIDRQGIGVILTRSVVSLLITKRYIKKKILFETCGKGIIGKSKRAGVTTDREDGRQPMAATELVPMISTDLVSHGVTGRLDVLRCRVLAAAVHVRARGQIVPNAHALVAFIQAFATAQIKSRNLSRMNEPHTTRVERVENRDPQLFYVIFLYAPIAPIACPFSISVSLDTFFLNFL